MCELLGMSANVPTDLRFSFAGLMRRAGTTARHSDGWGVAFHDGRDCQIFREKRAGAQSALAAALCDHPIRSPIAVAHIRRANRGAVSTANTHPFQRELWGRWWVFAHNGQLAGIKRWPLGQDRPVGTTDSEHAFCWLIGELRRSFGRTPGEAALCRAIARLCRRLDTLGTCNALLSDGRRLYAYCSSKLAVLTRRAPFGPACLIDADLRVDFAAETTPRDVVTIIATRPLTADEAWQPIERRSLAVYRDGELVFHDRAPRARRVSAAADPSHAAAAAAFARAG
jgi:predicted glutamine amidotransferase